MWWTRPEAGNWSLAEGTTPPPGRPCTSATEPVPSARSRKPPHQVRCRPAAAADSPGSAAWTKPIPVPYESSRYAERRRLGVGQRRVHGDQHLGERPTHPVPLRRGGPGPVRHGQLGADERPVGREPRTPCRPFLFWHRHREPGRQQLQQRQLTGEIKVRIAGNRRIQPSRCAVRRSPTPPGVCSRSGRPRHPPGQPQ
jgi:hypothetical protein